MRSKLGSIMAMVLKYAELTIRVDNLKERTGSDLAIHDMLLQRTYPTINQKLNVSCIELERIEDAIQLSEEFDDFEVKPSHLRRRCLMLLRKSKIAKALMGEKYIEEQTRTFDFVTDGYMLSMVVEPKMLAMMYERCAHRPKREEDENEEE